jgi:hypothetical protein
MLRGDVLAAAKMRPSNAVRILGPNGDLSQIFDNDTHLRRLITHSDPA